MLFNLLFYGLAFSSLLSAFLVVSARQTIHSVLALILVFLSISGIFVIIDMTFLGFLLIVLYVGAVAVFFLFAILMFGNKPEKPSAWVAYEKFFLGITSCLFLVSLFGLHLHALAFDESLAFAAIPVFSIGLKKLGACFYTHYFLPFQLMGFVLFSAMLGGVRLALKKNNRSKKQMPFTQMQHKGSKKITLVSPPPRKGLKNV